jgi:lysophospholipase L1-like esterase
MLSLARAGFLGVVTAGALSCGNGASEPTISDDPVPDLALVSQLAAPRHLLGSALSVNQVRLSWKDISASESGFEILRSTGGSNGSYSLVGTTASNATTFTNSGLLAGREYCYQVRAKAGGGASTSAGSNRVCARTMAGTSPAVRVVTFGDSNTDWGLNGTNPQVLATAYVSESPFSAAMLPHGSDQLAAKIERRWRAVRSNAIRVVNHAISGTTTGGGSFGGPNRRWTGAPNARTSVGGVTRFQGEVLGAKWPWSGGEPVNEKYVDGALRRVQAFVPGANDFAYVSMGTNDASARLTTQQTLANLGWMIDQWRAAGRRADHFLLTTLAPRAGTWGKTIPALNNGIRALASSKGVVLIDLANYTSADNGTTWRASNLHVGDGVHYSESVREWLAARVVAEMRTRVP